MLFVLFDFDVVVFEEVLRFADVVVHHDVVFYEGDCLSVGFHYFFNQWG